jgi:hypothetical protein
MKKFIPLILFLTAVFTLYAGGGKEKPAPGRSGSNSGASNPYFSGDGGGKLSLAVLVPEGKSLAAGQSYLPTLVQGVFVSDFAKYSGIQVLDRQNLEKILVETESGIYKNEDFLKLGEIHIGHAMTGSVTKTASGYALQIQVAPVSAGANAVTLASYSATCTAAELDDFSAIKKASLDLLTQMGVNLTDRARAELSGAAAVNEVDGQTALAQGILAQKSGTVVEALSYYFQAVNYDPSQAEAASRLNILSSDISSGNMGEDVRNDIEWRRQWVARLTEAEQFYINYVKQPAPYYLVYSTDLQQGKIDYASETVSIGFTIQLVPNAAWIETIVKVINTVRNGLWATGRAREWGLDWPDKSIARNTPFVDRDERFNVAVELVNDRGQTIGSENVTLEGGWDIYIEYIDGMRGDDRFLMMIPKSSQSYYTSRSSIRVVPGKGHVQFPRVNANSITDKLTIRIKSIDGVNAETAAKTKAINILTEAQYALLPEVQAGTDGRSMAKYPIIAYGRIRVPNDESTIIIRASIWGIPVTAMEFYNVHNLISATSVTLPANLDDVSNYYARSLYDAYKTNGKKAGTYTRPHMLSGEWTYQPR